MAEHWVTACYSVVTNRSTTSCRTAAISGRKGVPIFNVVLRFFGLNGYLEISLGFRNQSVLPAKDAGQKKHLFVFHI